MGLCMTYFLLEKGWRKNDGCCRCVFYGWRNSPVDGFLLMSIFVSSLNSFVFEGRLYCKCLLLRLTRICLWRCVDVYYWYDGIVVWYRSIYRVLLSEFLSLSLGDISFLSCVCVCVCFFYLLDSLVRWLTFSDIHNEITYLLSSKIGKWVRKLFWNGFVVRCLYSWLCGIEKIVLLSGTVYCLLCTLVIIVIFGIFGVFNLWFYYAMMSFRGGGIVEVACNPVFAFAFEVIWWG